MIDRVCVSVGMGLLQREADKSSNKGSQPTKPSSTSANAQGEEEKAKEPKIVWNHYEFRVKYPSLEKDVSIDGMFLRLLLEACEVEDGYVEPNDAAGANEEADGSSLRASATGVEFRDPRSFFHACYHEFLTVADAGLTVLDKPALGRAIGEDRELCLRAMTAAYRAAPEEIGTFTGIPHLVQLLDRTMSHSLRHRILVLLRELIRNEKNSIAFVDAEGLELIVDLLTGVHDAVEKAALPLETKLLTDYAHDQLPREWYLKKSQDESEPSGPHSKSELKELRERGKLTGDMLIYAEGMPEYTHVRDVRDIRWLLSTGERLLTPVQVGEICLDLLLNVSSDSSRNVPYVALILLWFFFCPFFFLFPFLRFDRSWPTRRRRPTKPTQAEPRKFFDQCLAHSEFSPAHDACLIFPKSSLPTTPASSQSRPLSCANSWMGLKWLNKSCTAVAFSSSPWHIPALISWRLPGCWRPLTWFKRRTTSPTEVPSR